MLNEVKQVENMKNSEPILGLRLPEELKREFVEEAEKLDITPSQIARSLIRDWLKQRKQQQQQSQN